MVEFSLLFLRKCSKISRSKTSTFQDMHPDKFRTIWSAPNLMLQKVFSLKKGEKKKTKSYHKLFMTYCGFTFFFSRYSV